VQESKCRLQPGGRWGDAWQAPAQGAGIQDAARGARGEGWGGGRKQMARLGVKWRHCGAEN